MNAAHSDYSVFADRMMRQGILFDPWFEGAPRFIREPVILPKSARDVLYGTAEDVAAVYNEVAQICAADPAVLDEFFRLSPFQKVMALSSLPLWHGIARADVFLTSSGPIVCELNSDTPSGEPEAVALNAVVAADHPRCDDPNARLGERFCQMLETFARGLGLRAPLSVGIIYPTEITEDLAMVRLYQRWFEERGWRVTLGSPFNLSSGRGDRAYLLGEPCDLFVRHYKTDWWGERAPVWSDEAPFPDDAPLEAPLFGLIRAVLAGRAAVINPFGAVVTQNKRAMAFMWERIDRVSSAARETIRCAIPYSVRLEAIPRERLLAEKSGWVLKSDYGCEGDSVVVGMACSDDEWRESLEKAVPGRWIAQRHFESRRDATGLNINCGVYVVAGKAAGIFSRVDEGVTGPGARCAPTLVLPDVEARAT